MLRFLCLVLLLTAGLLPARGQEITLPQLLRLRELPLTLAPTEVQAMLVREHLGDWAPRPAAPGEPRTWVWWPPQAGAGQLPQARLRLRPSHGGYEVELSVRRGEALSRLRNEAERLNLVSQPLPCPGCLGERFADGQGTLDFLQGQPEPFPFHVIVQASGSRAAPPPAARASQ